MRTYRSRGSVVKWYGSELANAVRKVMQKRTEVAAEEVKDQTQLNIGIPGPIPSDPGDYPKLQTGELRDDIFFRKAPRSIIAASGGAAAIAGTTKKYGVWVEVGHPGGKLILPKRASVLRWYDYRLGSIQIRAQVVQGRLVGRQYLQRTLKLTRFTVARILTRPISLALLKANGAVVT